MNKYTYSFIISLLRVFNKKPHITGLENYDKKNPAIFVSNHLGSFGPVIMKTFFPVDLVPWVTYEIMDKGLCPEYLQMDFVEKELKLKPPFSVFISKMLSKICIALLKHIRAIPVYKNGRAMLTAINETVHKLESGHEIVIFPEIPNVPSHDRMNEFYTGFVNIAKYFYAKNQTDIAFYPVGIHKEKNAISLAKPIIFDHENVFPIEKKRIIGLLRTSILKMLSQSNNLSMN